MVVGIIVVVIAVAGIGGAILKSGAGPSGNQHENVIDLRSENEINLGYENNGTIIRISVGAAVIIQLEENPTTGYTWQYIVNENVLQVIGDNYIPSESVMVGSGGIRILKLNAMGSGEGEVNMDYVRPWENQPVDHFSVILRVG